MADLSSVSDDDLKAMYAKATAPAVAPTADLSQVSDDDLKAMYARATAPNPKPDKTDVGGVADAGMRGVVKGSTLGFGDELYGLVGAAVNPTNSTEDFSHRYHEARDYARNRDAQAEQAHPVVSAAGQAAGGLATAFAPGLGALNAGKGAGLIEMGAKGAAQGALAGAGDAKEFTDIPDAALHGAVVGGALGAGLGAAGKVGSAVLYAAKPARVASVLLNVPEEAVQRYINSPASVNAARPRSEIVQDFLKRAEALKQDVVGGSKASRDILTNEGKTISGSELADIFDRHADEIATRSEGVMDDPQQLAAYKWLKSKAQAYRPSIPEDVTDGLADHFEHHAAGFQMEVPQLPPGMTARQALEAEADKQLTTNRVKDLVQGLQNRTQYETAPGQFADVSDLVRQKVATDVNARLKATSPAYAKQMQSVAKDTGLLNDVGDLAKSPQGFDNLLRRTQRGNTPHIMDSLNQFDQRTGGGMMSELGDSAVKDAMDRTATNGSRNVNLHSGVAESVGAALGGPHGWAAGKLLGVLGGASVDKYGPAMARGAVDGASKIQSMLNSSEGLQTLGKYAGPLMDAAKRGNQSLAVTHFVLSQTDPNYAMTVNGK